MPKKVLGSQAGSVSRGKKINLLLAYPDLAEKIVEQMRAGNYLETAAAYAGVGVSTVRFWVADGHRDLMEGKDTEYSRFAQAVDRARAEATIKNVANIAKAADGEPGRVDKRTKQFVPGVRGEWTASAWWLERTDPEKWGRRDRVRISVDQAAQLTDEEIDRELRLRGLA